jgi:hypothetical protein
MRGDIPALPQYVFMAWCLVKHRDNFTFTFHHKSKQKLSHSSHRFSGTHLRLIGTKILTFVALCRVSILLKYNSIYNKT